MRSADAYCAYFGVVTGAGRVLAYLVGLGGREARRDAIAEALGYAPGSVKVFMAMLRNSMEAESIDTRRDRHHDQAIYSLTDIGRAECAKALAEQRRARA